MQQEQKDLNLIETPSIREVQINCPDHGEMSAKIFCFNGNESPPICKLCSLEKEEKEKEKVEKQKIFEETQRKKNLASARIGSAMIPARFKDHSFETFVEKTREHTSRKQRCKEYAEKFPELSQRGVSMIFCGTTGTGKTHLACAIANHIMTEYDKNSMFLSVMDAVRMVKETYSKKSESTERQAIAKFLFPDLLILDEVGVQFGTDTEKMILFEIINKRYENLKSTILLSNLAMPLLTDFVGERIVDRMKENGGRVLTFDFKSYRENK